MTAILKKICKSIFLVIFLFLSKAVFAGDVPIIVIAPGKTVQSKSIVGSDVVVIDSKKLEQ